MSWRIPGFWAVVAAAGAVAACAGGGTDGEVELARTGVSEECLSLRAELQSCIDGGWNRAECQSTFREARAARGVDDECTPNAACADVRAWYRTCLDDGGDTIDCADRFYQDREDNFVEPECTPAPSCPRLRDEFKSCIEEGAARPDCEAAFSDELVGSVSTCSVDDL
jgi:hypothetical protein